MYYTHINVFKITMRIDDYDCRNAFRKVDIIEYLDELEKGNSSLESAKILADVKKYADAYIILYKSLQNIGNAVLINRFKLRSKSKNCQFKYLHEENILLNEDIKNISEFSELRNNIYYNNFSFQEIEKEEYKKYYNNILEIINKLKEEIK